MSHKKIDEWVERQKGLLTNVNDASPWRSSTVTCDEVKEQAYQRIRDNQRINSDEVACETRISHGRKLFKNG